MGFKKLSLGIIGISLVLTCAARGQSSFTVISNLPPDSGGLDTELIDLIDGATSSVDASIYSLGRQGVVDALFNAHSRGVTVRIVTESDSYDSTSYGPYYEELEEGGITIVQDNAGGGGSGLCHNKFFVFDDDTVWTGSYNVTDNGTVANANHAIIIENSDVAEAYTKEFEEMYLSYDFGTAKSDDTTHYFQVDGLVVESYFNPTDDAKLSIQSEIETAAHSVYFIVYTFTDDDVAESLFTAYSEGDGVIVAGAIDSAQKNVSGSEYNNLRAEGIPVRVDTLSGLLHHKLMIIDPFHDSGRVITGSSNWTAAAFNKNDEDVLIIHSPALAEEFYSLFEQLYFNYCEEEGGPAGDSLVLNEVMSAGDFEEIPYDDRSNWAEGEEGGSPGERGDPDTVPPIIVHTPITRAIVGRPIQVHCEIYDPNDPTMYSAKDATLYYRKAGGAWGFQSVHMGAFFDKYSGTIPDTEVTTDGVEYYLTTRDWSYNLATHPAFAPQSYPHEITVEDSANAVIRFTEIMYDPGLDIDDEDPYEWLEIYNSGASTVSLTGWEFTDGEGSYIFPPGAQITAGEYQVLCKSELGPSGSFTRYTYGPDSVGNITLNNPLGVVSDQLILKDGTGLVVEEVDYSANWGASNVRGPNKHSLEKIDPTGVDDETNWMYSMVEGGTPGEEASNHFVFHTYYLKTGYKTRPGMWINPTLINPGVDIATVYYRINRDCDVTLKVYNPPDGTDPDYCFEESYFLVTLLDEVAQTENMDPETYDSYYISWDGTYASQTAIGNLRLVLSATDSESNTCVCDSNDTMMSTLYHGFDPDPINVMAQQPTLIKFYQSKPAFISAYIKAKQPDGAYGVIRHLVDGLAMPLPPDGVEDNVFSWDNRTDEGTTVEMFSQISAEIEAEDIFGNVLISRPPLEIWGVQADPREYLCLDEDDEIIISYNLNVAATVSLWIEDGTGQLVEQLLDEESKTAGLQQTTWEVQSTAGDGIYTFTIEAEALEQKGRATGYLAIYSFE